MKKMFIILSLILGGFLVAQDFDSNFENKTLRIDYIFGGDKENQYILVDNLVSFDTWAGRRINLSKPILKGDGQIRVFKPNSGELIYVQSFSTLFQEWLSTEGAGEIKRSFENVFLVPFPKQSVEVEVVLFNHLGKELVKLRHSIDPTDILIQRKPASNIPYKYLHRGKHSENAINVVFVAEGYQENELNEYEKYAQAAVDELLSYTIFNKYKEYFNFILLKNSSLESGVSVPREAIWKKTALEANFDTFYSERYLTTKNVKKIHDLLIGIPYEHIIVLANTDVYGGGGIYNFYALTTTKNLQFKPVIVHEFGHSFAGLADEYFYPDDVLNEMVSSSIEPWQQNITTLVDFNQKWAYLLDTDLPVPTPLSEAKKYPIGVYKAHKDVDIYTSELDCRMKTNVAKQFCVVCQNSIEKVIRFYIGENFKR